MHAPFSHRSWPRLWIGRKQPICRRFFSLRTISLVSIPSIVILLALLLPLTPAKAAAPLQLAPLKCPEGTSGPASAPAYKGILHCRDGAAEIMMIDPTLVQFETVLAEGFEDQNDDGAPDGDKIECRDVNLPLYSTGPGCKDATGKYPAELVGAMAARYIAKGSKVALVLNTDFFDNAQYGHGPQGLVVKNGNRFDGPSYGDMDGEAAGEPSLSLSTQGNIRIGRANPSDLLGGEGDLYPGVTDRDAYFNTVGGGPLLVEGGEPVVARECADSTHSCPYKDVARARTAVGKNAEGQLIVVVIPETAGVTLPQLADLMVQKLKAVVAINFDGGGSSQLWYDGRYLVPSYESRRVAEGLLVSAQRTGVDVALIIDSTGSMSVNDPGGLRKAAAKELVDIAQPGDKIAVIAFDTGAYRLAALTEIKAGTEQQLAKAELRRAIDFVGQDGNTDLNAGLNAGFSELLSDTSNQRRAAVFLTDGEQTSGTYDNNSHLRYRNSGWPVYTIGFGDADFALLSKIAAETQGECLNKCQSFTDLSQLQVFYHDVLQRQIANGNILLSQSSLLAQGESQQLAAPLPPGQDSATFLAVWPGSQVDLSLISPSGRVIDASTPADDVYHSKQPTYETFTIQNPEVGAWRVNVYGAALAAGGERVDVRVSSRGLRMPSLFLPNIRSELPPPPPVCTNGTFTPVDVMFALDRSESFATQNRIGRSKVAIVAFMDTLANTGEQVALTKFSKVVELSQPLTTDRQALYNLLVNVPEAQGTAIGDAIRVAADELLGPRHIPGHRPVLIVFSDGENTDGSDPLQQANAAKARGIRVFTVSSWENVDKDLLRKLASSPGDFYYTAGTHDMAESAKVIADRVRCGN